MRTRIIIITAVAIVAATTSILIIKNNMKEKEYWVVGAYPTPVNERIKRGYKVIGKYKLSNFQPRPITVDDAEFIKSKLPEWLVEHYPNETVDVLFEEINNQDFVNKLHYVFTMLHKGGTTEADFYLLKLRSEGKMINIYIGKGVDADPYTPPLTQKLIYPFYDEEWHSNVDDPKPFQPGDFW